METTDAHSLTPEEEMLRGRVRDLEAQLEEQERNLYQAATMGNSLLEHNSDLRQRIDDMMKQHADALEEKEQEVCTLQSRVEVASSTERWQQEEISHARADLQAHRANLTQQLAEEKRMEIAVFKRQKLLATVTSQSCIREETKLFWTNLTQQMEKEKRMEIVVFKRQIASQQQEIDRLQAVDEELRRHKAELEALLQTHLDRTQIQSLSASFSSEEMAQLVEERTRLSMDVTELQAKNLEVSGELQRALSDKESLAARLKLADVETEDLQHQIVTYAKHLEASRTETLEARAELDAARVDSQAHGCKGNSLFSEIEDRRMVLERMMASLKVQNQQLKEKHEIEKQQNQKYKMQIAMALQMSSHKQDPAAQRLREQLNDAHGEIRTLTELLQKLEASKDSLPAADLLDNAEDKHYAKYLMEVIKKEKEHAAEACSELRSKSLQYLDVRRQTMELTRQTQQLQAQRDQLQSQLIKVTMEKEELLAQYEPDKVKKGTVQRRFVEKIGMGDRQTQVQEKVVTASGKVVGVSGRPSDVFKAGSSTGRPSAVFRASSASVAGTPMVGLRSVSKAGIAKAEPSAAQKAGAMEGKPVDTLKASGTSSKAGEASKPLAAIDNDLSFLLPQGRRARVSIADEVQIISGDGQESKVALQSEGQRLKPAEVTAKSKTGPAKVVRNVQHVSGENAQQCKTQ